MAGTIDYKLTAVNRELNGYRKRKWSTDLNIDLPRIELKNTKNVLYL